MNPKFKAATAADDAVGLLDRKGIFSERVSDGLSAATFILSEVRHAAQCAAETPEQKAEIMERLWLAVVAWEV